MKTKTFVLACLLLIVSGHGFAAHVIPGSLNEYTSYDSFGHPLSITLGGVARNFRYNSAGCKTFESYPGSGSGTSYTCDALNRVKSATNGDGSSRSYHYGPGSMSVTDERGRTTTYTYRSYGNPDQQILMGISAPDSSLSLSRNSHDLVTSASQGGITRSYGYSGTDYLVSVSNPETGTTSYGRDGAGNMTSRSVGGAGTTNYSYDGQNRVTAISYPGSTPSVTMSYSPTNKLKTVNSSTANRSYSYDADDNLVRETLTLDGLTFTTGYSYDGNDQLASISYPQSNRTVAYSPDVLGRPTQASGYVSSASYWPSGQVNQISYTNGASSSYAQNTRQWPSSFVAHSSAGTFVNSSYSYDGAGNLTSISDSDSRYNRSLSYDGANRLTSVSGPWGSGSITYDGSGNITHQTYGGSSLNYTYSSNRLSSISGSRTASFAYDGYGDIISGGGNTYTYDGVPNLRCANCTDKAHRIDYTYDGLNQRVSSGRTFGSKGGMKTYEVYGAHGKLLAEYTPNQSKRLVEHIYLGNKRIAQRVTMGGSDDSAPTSTITYYHDDIAGTPLAATDATGKLLWKENYRPYGDKLTNAAASAENHVGYAGKPFDNKTGLSYMGARYYDPVLGRFTGIDPKEVDPSDIHSFNRYAYANNNPYKFVDPDGRSPVEVGLVLLGVGLAANEIATSDVPMIGGGIVKAAVAVENAVASIAKVATSAESAVAANGVARLGPKGVDALHHNANVTIRDAAGNMISHERVVSGNMTAAEKALGFPKGSLASHTEARAVGHNSLEPGQSMTITGQNPPCPSCKGAMNRASAESGATIRYQWRQDGATQSWTAGP